MIVVASIKEAAAAVSRTAAEVALATKEDLPITDRVVTGTTVMITMEEAILTETADVQIIFMIVDRDQTAADMVTSVMKAAMVVAATGEVEMTGAENPTAKEGAIITAAAAKETVSIDTVVVLVEQEEEVVVEIIVIVIDETNQLMPVLRLVWRSVTPVDPS